MIEFESNSYQREHNELLGLNQLSLGGGVNKAGLCAPHINASKNMSKNLVINDYINYQNENDIYDFSAGDPNQSEVNEEEEENMYRYNINNEDYDEEEDDDINFDYEYGYDYERVIKDRLQKANQDFVNDSEPSKRKSILVSFDNAVTAHNITIEEQQKLLGQNDGQNINFLNSEEKEKFNNALKDELTDENNVVKLPLNDTVQKDDPDAFANQIRQKNSEYDAQVQAQNNLFYEENNQNIPTEINSSNTVNVNIIEKEQKISNNEQSNSRNSSPSTFNNKDTNNYKSSTPSPPPPLSDNNNKTTKQKTKKSSPVKFNVENESNLNIMSDWADSSQTRSDDSILKNNEKKVSNKQKEKINAHNNRTISFSAVSKEDIESPSPISSSRSTPEPKKNDPPGLKNSKNKEEEVPDENENEINSSELNTERTITDGDNDNTLQGQGDQNNDNNERILVEKDGIFKLMTTEEHTAYEKQKKQERIIQEKINNNKKDSNSQLKKQISPISVIPHPPPKPRDQNKNKKERPKSSIIQRDSRSMKTRFENSNNTSINNSNSFGSQNRLSHSADGGNSRGRSKSASNRRTPEYATDYKSPYQVTCRIVKPSETLEEKRLREQEGVERKMANENAFKAWLKSKNDLIEHNVKISKKVSAMEEQNSPGNGTMTTNSDDRVTFETWLQKKQQQLENEKDFKKITDKYNINNNTTTVRKQTPEETSKAYKEWLNKKNKEKIDQSKQDKLELRKWTSKRRRSRKHQRLSQALELAQAYGYNSSFRTPGGPFNF